MKSFFVFLALCFTQQLVAPNLTLSTPIFDPNRIESLARYPLASSKEIINFTSIEEINLAPQPFSVVYVPGNTESAEPVSVTDEYMKMIKYQQEWEEYLKREKYLQKFREMEELVEEL